MCSPGDEYLSFLADAGCDPGVIEHCKTVRDVALRIASDIIRTGVHVALDRVAAGAILHDIGRSRTHGMAHADEGGDICRSKGLDEAICRIVERHIGAGLYADERARFGLSAVDRIPETLEEKIVAHADNLVKGTRVVSREEFVASLQRFDKPVRSRFLDLADELERLSGAYRD
ncbi:MAG TPA: HDIG domain-containing protein [Methanospirillum sp.]|uniref:HDIG domain-containing metalloprotein n=1 Tax=Methanospirillum sp. TaxID=45200 RepID=UPI002C4CC6BC|nr:HDIG domain-containing metalloprotein [Methanospirillum sp.]HOJ97063.1 HDIG domain-containing protein [Methanospirillum sp.]